MHCSQKILNSIFVHEPSRSCLEANCSGAKCCNQRSKKLVENFKGKHNFGEQNQRDKSRENIRLFRKFALNGKKLYKTKIRQT